MENMVPLSEGGAMRRSGTRYVATTQSNTVKSRLKRFEFNTEQAYILEMGEQYIRFYRNQQQIMVADTDASITNGDFTSDVTGWTDLSNGTGAIAWNASGYMDLTSAVTPGNEAIAEQSVTLTTTGVEHVLKFEVIGPPGDSIIVRVGSSSGADDYMASFFAQVGFHAIAFTPSASPFFLQFENDL
jgi:hypothetical protein